MEYILKKFSALIITLFIITFLAFLAFQVIPGDPTSSILGTEATPEKIAALRSRLGLDLPFFTRYFNWLKEFVTGSMGVSYNYQMTVKEMLAGKIPITAVLTAMSFFMIIIVSIPLGMWQAKHAGKLRDRSATAVSQVAMSIPPFFLGIIITLVCGIILKLFTPGNYVSYTENLPGFLLYLIFPAVAIAIPRAAMTAKMLRSSIMGEVDKDYVRTAYSRGNSSMSVMYGHILRNAVIPVITFLAMTVSDIVANSIIIEQVFSIPGIGRLLLTSIANRDYPVVQAIIVIMAFIVVFVNFLVDVIYQFVDPRIKLE